MYVCVVVVVVKGSWYACLREPNCIHQGPHTVEEQAAAQVHAFEINTSLLCSYKSSVELKTCASARRVPPTQTHWSWIHTGFPSFPGDL